MIARSIRIAVALVAAGLVAACTSSKPVRVVTVTTTPTPPVTNTATPSPTTSGSTPNATPSASHLSSFKGTCDTLLPDGAVFNAINIDPLPGADDFVVGKADPTIHRLAYLNCRYGVTRSGSTATPPIEIGVSLYQSAAEAAQRIKSTVDDYTAHGASATATQVDGSPATMLTGGAGDGYDVPTLVTSSGQRTVAVSIDGSVATGAQADKDATLLASLALDHTAG
jgi:hypothetical protein